MELDLRNKRSEVPRADVETTLQRVLESKPFVRSERLQRFLRYVVAESLEGRADRLNGYSIGLDVFDRPEGFDPAVDTIVRVEARRLRQALTSYYASDGTAEPLVISMPTGGYVPVFELQKPSGNSFAETNTMQARGPVVAVLPFENYSADNSEDYFANGLTEQLIATLTRFSDLSVISRTTIFQYRNAKVPELRHKLGIDYVFEGSIRKSATTLRTTAQFIDVSTDTHLWAATFDRALSPENLFDVQDDISETIAARIADRYGPLGRVGGRSAGPQTNSLEAYAALLKFYDNYAQHSVQGHAEAREMLEGAVILDPKFADAWAALSAIHLDEYRFGFNSRRDDDPPLARALKAAAHAVSLNPACAMAHQFLACAYFHDGNDAAFNVSAEEALRLNPGHADLLADIGSCYGFLGEIQKGLSLIDRAITLNPSHPGWYHHFPALSLYLSGQYDAALAEATRGHMAGFYWTYALKTAIYAKLGRDSDASHERDLLLDAYPEFPSNYVAEARKWRASDEMIAALGEGLRKAGLDVG